ncbi:hypothetical protein ScPMuIL_008093 [Solemya velum]
MDEEAARDEDITFESLGIPTSAPLAETAFGTVRRLSDLDKKEIVYGLCSCLGLVGVLALTIYRLAVVDTKDPDFAFALMLLLNTIFCSFYLIHGLLRERPYEILILSVAVLVIWVYIVINFDLGTKTTVKITRLVIATVVSPVMIVLGLLIVKQYRDSGRLIFRTVGANTLLQNLCKTMFMCFGVIKLDLQLGISMLILILTHADKVNTEDIVILSVGGVITIAWFLIGYISMRRENRVLSIVYFAGFPFEPAYVIYKIVASAQDQNSKNDELAATTYTCAALALVVRAILLYLSIAVFRNFGKGLKEKAFGEEETVHAVEQLPENPQPT